MIGDSGDGRGEQTADCLPHEQVAFSAQTQEPERLQQVAGLVTILAGVGNCFCELGTA